MELGPKDLDAKSVVLARRDTAAKETVAWADVATRVPQLLEEIQVSRMSMGSLRASGPGKSSASVGTALAARLGLQIPLEDPGAVWLATGLVVPS
jgi:hypothetical protein